MKFETSVARLSHYNRIKMENTYLLIRKSGGVPEASWLTIMFPKNWISHSSGNFSALPPSAI